MPCVSADPIGGLDPTFGCKFSAREPPREPVREYDFVATVTVVIDIASPLASGCFAGGLRCSLAW